MEWFICCGNTSQQTPSSDGKVSIVNLDNTPNNNRTIVNDSPSDTNAHLLASSSHPTHSGSKKNNNNLSSTFNNNTDLPENPSRLSNKASIV